MTQEINHEAGTVAVYHYDAGGNLSYRNRGPYDPNHITELWKDKTYTYGDANWKDKLTAYNGKAITYDKIGNPLTYDGWTYTWEAGRQLKKQVKGNISIEYVYDENGLRTQKKTTENDKTTVYDYVWKGDRLIGLTIDAGISIEYLYFFYDEDGKAAGFVHDNTDVYFYQLDAQGNVNAIVKQDGTTAAQYTYDAWGNLLSSTGKMAKINPLTYRGYQYDHETGLYYLQSRYYNPEWGRFINADSILGTSTKANSFNLMMYCSNDPVNYIDTQGTYEYMNRETFSEFGFIVVFMRAVQLNLYPDTVEKENKKIDLGICRRYRGTNDCIRGIISLAFWAVGMAAIAAAGIDLILVGSGATALGSLLAGLPWPITILMILTGIIALTAGSYYALVAIVMAFIALDCTISSNTFVIRQSRGQEILLYGLYMVEE